jgi:hypothetical protein
LLPKPLTSDHHINMDCLSNYVILAFRLFSSNNFSILLPICQRTWREACFLIAKENVSTQW